MSPWFYESLIVRLGRNQAAPAVFFVENTASENARKTIAVLIDVLKDEVLQHRE